MEVRYIPEGEEDCSVPRITRKLPFSLSLVLDLVYILIGGLKYSNVEKP